MSTRLLGILGAIVGLVVGYPLSYFVLPAGDRPPLAFSGYLERFMDIVTRRELQLPILVTCVFSVVALASLGALVGRLAARGQ